MSFQDYYYILQVHQDAQAEIIKSAYRRLAQLYHPDSNPDKQALVKMQQINEAYAILSDEYQRQRYHRQWQLINQKQKTEKPPKTDDKDKWAENWQRKARDKTRTRQKSAEMEKEAAQQALQIYFRSLLAENWEDAYAQLTNQDQKQVPFSDFVAWKEAVDVLFQMGSYVIKPFRVYRDVLIGQEAYQVVYAFSVYLTDRDRRTQQVNEEISMKYVVRDADGWRVCLGYTQLQPIILNLKYIAAQAPSINPAHVYAEALLKHDQQTGFFSRHGLIDQLEREVDRTRRFGHDFALAVITIQPKKYPPDIASTDYEQMCLMRAAEKLRETMRKTDSPARISTKQLAVLLVETNQQQAAQALQRLKTDLACDQTLTYDLRGSVTVYQGATAEETMLDAENEARLQILTDTNKRGRVRINVNDRQQ